MHPTGVVAYNNGWDLKRQWRLCCTTYLAPKTDMKLLELFMIQIKEYKSSLSDKYSINIKTHKLNN